MGETETHIKQERAEDYAQHGLPGVKLSTAKLSERGFRGSEISQNAEGEKITVVCLTVLPAQW